MWAPGRSFCEKMYKCGEVQARRSRRLEWRSVWKGNQERRNGGRKTKKKTYIEVEGQFVMIIHMCAVL